MNVLTWLCNLLNNPLLFSELKKICFCVFVRVVVGV